MQNVIQLELFSLKSFSFSSERAEISSSKDDRRLQVKLSKVNFNGENPLTPVSLFKEIESISFH